MNIQKFKQWWKSRLVWAGVLITSINLPDLFSYLSDNKDNWLPSIPEKYQHIIVGVLGIAVVILRFNTTHAIVKSDS